MKIRLGCELVYDFPARTPMIVMLNVHYSQVANLEQPDHLRVTPATNLESYRDGFGNWCYRLVAPAGGVTIGTDTIVRSDGRPDPVDWYAIQHPVELLPPETLVFLLGSRYCETDRLSEEAWRLFGSTPPGW
eukprot:gene38413-46418_t